MGDKPKLVQLKRKPDPDAALIAECRDLLADAESGKLLSLAYVAEYAGDDDPLFYAGGQYDPWRTRGLLSGLQAVVAEETE